MSIHGSITVCVGVTQNNSTLSLQTGVQQNLAYEATKSTILWPNSWNIWHVSQSVLICCNQIFTHWRTNINFPCCNCLNPSYFQFASFFCQSLPRHAICFFFLHIHAKNNVWCVVYSFKCCSLKSDFFSHFQLNPTVTNSGREVGEFALQ